MSRIVKVKAWHKLLEEFVPIHRNCVIDRDGNICPTDNVVIIQFTGLHDINGVEIYEGDIIEATSRQNPYDSKAIFKIHYDQVYGSFVGHVVKRIFPVLQPANWPLGELRFDAKVIGNLYQNPELLESE